MKTLRVFKNQELIIKQTSTYTPLKVLPDHRTPNISTVMELLYQPETQLSKSRDISHTAERNQKAHQAYK